MNPLKRKIPKSALDTIAHRLTSRKYAKLFDDLQAVQRKCGTQLYYEVFKGKVSSLANAPDGWLPKTQVLRVRLVDGEGKAVGLRVIKVNRGCGGQLNREASNQTSLWLPMEMALTVPYEVHTKHVNVYYKNPSISQFVDLTEQYVDLELEREAFLAQMTNTIALHGSWFKLYEAWPEVRELISDLEPQEELRLLPAFGNIEDLNKTLGLTCDKTA